MLGFQPISMNAISDIEDTLDPQVGDAMMGSMLLLGVGD